MTELDKFLKLQMVPYKLVRADNGDAWVEVIILPLLHSCITSTSRGCGNAGTHSSRVLPGVI